MPLEPSDRVSLIKEVTRRLASEEWPLIDVTLRQFSLPWTDDWQGSREAYVIDMIEKATDEVLISLARHVGYEIEERRPKLDPPFWRQGYFRLFVTHLAKFRREAAELQEQLLLYGVSSFVAHNDIEPSTEWQNEIQTALATAETVVALLRPGFHESNWTDQEIGYAMGRNLLVLTVRLGQDPYGFIGRFQAFNGEGKSAADLAREIFDVLVKHKQTRARLAEALVVLFEQSDSFAEAKRCMGLLEQATYWRPSLAERVRAASKSNSQISQAWGVPGRIEALLMKWT